MTMATIHQFPSHKYERAVDVVGLLHAKHARAAAREGKRIPEAPKLEVLRRYPISICNHCGVREEGFAGGSCMACKRGAIMTRDAMDIMIHAERPVVGEWEFLAVVEPLAGGNLIRQAPGASIVEGTLAMYRNAKIECSHCKLARDRKETFVVRNIASDTEEMAIYRQVGRSCLKSFLPSGGYEWAIESMTIVDRVRELAADSEAWVSGESRWEPIEVLRWTASVVRLNSWMPKGKATEDRPATAGIVSGLLQAPTPGSTAYESWRRQREHFSPTSEDTNFATEAMKWIEKERASNTNASDYMHNLSLATMQPSISASKLGIVCSLIAAYGNAIAKDMKSRDSGIAPSNRTIGNVGEKISVRATLERVIEISGDYGPRFLHSFRSNDGAAIVWTTGKRQGIAGETFLVHGKVKSHTEYKGEMQTNLLRCKLESDGATSAQS